MSSRLSRGDHPRRTLRNIQRRKMVLNVDLNVPLPVAENVNDEGTSSHPFIPQQTQSGQSSALEQIQSGQDLVSLHAEGGQQGVPLPPLPIDVDSIDDDVIVSSPRAFAEAKHNSRRNRGRTIVDVDLEESARRAANNRYKRPRLPCQTHINVEAYEAFVNLELSADRVRDAMKVTAQPRFEPPMPPPPPPEPTFNCPVCMGPLVEEMSTKCGHIFCKGCIKAAIAAQKKCPTCRRKVTMKDTIRIYLPAAS